MRAGYYNVSVITHGAAEDSTGAQVVGLCLGYDFTAEHDRGIDGINRAFGIPGRPKRKKFKIIPGLRRDLIGCTTYGTRKVPTHLVFFESSEAGYLVYDTLLDKEECASTFV